MSIPSVDLTVVMSNLLDNAIEACEKLEKQERRMAVKAIYNKSDNPPTLFSQSKMLASQSKFLAIISPPPSQNRNCTALAFRM